MKARISRRLLLKHLFSLSALSVGSILLPGRPSAFQIATAGRAGVNTSEAKETNRDGEWMKKSSGTLKIDMFTHILPRNYASALGKITSVNSRLADLDKRFEGMDQLGETLQVLTLGQPPIEDIPDPEKAVDLARMANDGMAELVLKYPDRFAAATAALPMHDIDAAMKELDRAIGELHLKGLQVFTTVNGKPLDTPEFMPLYEKMAQYDLPIWIHPVSNNYPYYPVEKDSSNDFDQGIGWPHATSMAMVRLAATGVLERFPNLKFITHHSGGTIPYLAQRIEFAPTGFKALSKPIIDSLRLFYLDTAVQGNTSNLMCANAFCGADHQLYGTDFGMAGVSMVERVIRSINEMDIPEMDKRKIFSDNAKRILRLPI